MATKKTSYKEMLRNRLPTTVSLALKWCKAKEKWIAHVYDNWIKFIADKPLRKEVTRNILGLARSNRMFNFHTTINWETLNDDDKKEWETVEAWVIWFERNYLAMENAWDIGKKTLQPEAKIRQKMINTITSVDVTLRESLIDYLITHIKQSPTYV